MFRKYVQRSQYCFAVCQYLISNFLEMFLSLLIDCNLFRFQAKICFSPSLNPVSCTHFEGARERKLLYQHRPLFTYLLLTTSTRNCNNSRVFSGCPLERMKNKIYTLYTVYKKTVRLKTVRLKTAITVKTSLQRNLYVLCQYKLKERKSSSLIQIKQSP